ncbi:DUF4345 domain-containing protein [Sphingomonas jatrophae]|uniref:DUF4345 domain-containing protein n=1 Tax=Sphingomonas jatrophae TaxID=1166337 RepID=A0A1I6K4L9_9SPHN|nr:DUF4345 domain-containing protein [Sphingomonas jatrophae]SFR86205.1 protein of unknown function [Sphingomonas jatrophae]
MSPQTEQRLWQAVAGLACLVPLLAGGDGVLRGVRMVHGPLLPDLDSHFRYLSGIFLGVGVAFACAVVRIDRPRAGNLFRLLCGLVICGGLARLASLIAVGPPGPGHLFGLGMELGVVPLLALWQARVERRTKG